MGKTKIDYVGIALIKMASDKYAESEKFFNELCEHLQVPGDYDANVWDYVIGTNDPVKELRSLKEQLPKWKKEYDKECQRKRKQSGK